MQHSLIDPSWTRYENGAVTTSYSSRATRKNCNPSSRGRSATFPPTGVIAAVPGVPALSERLSLTINVRSVRRDPDDLKRAETVEKGHGRIETRRIAVRTKLPSRLNEKWPDLTAICRIERLREMKTYCTRQVIFAITSLPVDKLVPDDLLQLSREAFAERQVERNQAGDGGMN
jgi:hypothetical protein